MRDENVFMAEIKQILVIAPLPQILVAEIPRIITLVTIMLGAISKRKGRFLVFDVETYLEDNGALGTALPVVFNQSKNTIGTNKE